MASITITRLVRAAIITSCLVAVCPMFAIGMTPATSGALSHTDQREISNGFFGGIRNGATFVLLLSEQQGGIRFYRVQSDLMVEYNGRNIVISKLPVQTPVRITTIKGLVVEIAVLEVGR